MKRIVAFTGAGISRASGIPTFVEMGDLRNKLSREYFINNPEEFFKLLGEMKKTCDKAEPNPAHIALAQYDIPVVTMNIDGLHRRAGSKTLIEIHGNLSTVFCSKCKKVYDFEVVEKSIYCNECGRRLEPDVVLYGDSIPRYFDAIDLIGTADELLVVGTSFYTSTAADLVGMARNAGIKIHLINNDAEKEVPEYLKKVYEK